MSKPKKNLDQELAEITAELVRKGILVVPKDISALVKYEAPFTQSEWLNFDQGKVHANTRADTD